MLLGCRITRRLTRQDLRPVASQDNRLDGPSQPKSGGDSPSVPIATTLWHQRRVISVLLTTTPHRGKKFPPTLFFPRGVNREYGVPRTDPFRLTFM